MNCEGAEIRLLQRYCQRLEALFPAELGDVTISVRESWFLITGSEMVARTQVRNLLILLVASSACGFGYLLATLGVRIAIIAVVALLVGFIVFCLHFVVEEGFDRLTTRIMPYDYTLLFAPRYLRDFDGAQRDLAEFIRIIVALRRDKMSQFTRRQAAGTATIELLKTLLRS